MTWFLVMASILSQPEVLDRGPVFDRLTALDTIERVSGALGSFRALTELILEEAGLYGVDGITETTPYVRIHPSVLEGIGYTWWEEQNIGFTNWPIYIRGTIETQQLRILELERRVAELEGADAAVLEECDEIIRIQAAIVDACTDPGWAD